MKLSGAKSDQLVTKIANAEDEATGDAFEVFRFRKVLGRYGRVRIDRDQAREIEKVRKLLVRKNGALPRDLERADKIVGAAIRKSPRSHLLHSAHVGWRANRRGFVLQNAVIGDPNRKLKLRPPLWLNDRQQTFIGHSGDIETWIRKVARPCRYSSRLMLTLSAAFAAPLLHVIGLQPFGINLFGPSKVGKTSALLVATSVIGIGRESRLPNWNTSNASFQETARIFNDLILAANEVGLLAGKKGDAYQRIRCLIYVFAEGRDASRHSGSSFASSVANSAWRGIFVSTSEYSFNAYAAFAGDQRDHGEFARCLDVPAAPKKLPTVFDRRPKGVRKAQFKTWARQTLIAMRDACEKNHGVAIKPYIEYLIANDNAIEATIIKRMTKFEQAIKASELNGALQHAAKNFGLIYAGGCAAIDAKLLPWSKARLLAAVCSCFRAALRDLNAHEHALGKARTVLRRNLLSANITKRASNASFGPGDHSGFVESAGTGIVFTIHAKVFRAWFPNRAQLLAVLQWLDDDGYLVLSGKRSGPRKPHDTEWAEQSPRWPNGQNTRSIVFRDPFSGKATLRSLEHR